MQKSELKPMLMITNLTGKQEFFKVSTLNQHGFTAVLEWPIPQRTRVRELSYDELNNFRPLTDTEFRKYNRAWDSQRP